MNEILKNSIFIVADQIIVFLYGFCLSIFLTRILGKSEVGLYYVIINILSIISLISLFGIGGILSREIIKKSWKKSFYFSIYVSWLFFISFPIVVISSIATSLILYPEYKIHFFTASFLVVSMSLYNFTLLVWTNSYKVNLSVALDSIKALSIFFLLIFFVILGYSDLLSVYIVQLIVVSFTTGLSLYWLHRKLKFRIEIFFNKKMFKKILLISAPLVIGAFSEYISLRIDNVMISILVNLEASGIYSIAYNLFLASIAIPVAISKLFVPEFINRIKNSQNDAFSFLKKYILYIFSIVILIIMFFIVFGEKFVILMYGKTYQESWKVMNILLLALIFITLNRLLAYALISLNKQNVYSFFSFIGMIANIVLNLVLIPVFSFYGAAVSTIITEGIVFFMEFIYIYRFFAK